MRTIRAISVTAITIGLLAGSAAGALAQDETVPRPPVEIDGRVTCGPVVDADGWGHDEQVELGAETTLTRYRGGTWHQIASVSDPRLEGAWYHTWESDTYGEGDAEDGTTVAASTWRVENDEGAWGGGKMELVFADGTTAEETLTLLHGEGAYAGLTAILDMRLDESEGACGSDFRGVIVEGMPPMEPYRPE